jgi:hypothetical protein
MSSAKIDAVGDSAAGALTRKRMWLTGGGRRTLPSSSTTSLSDHRSGDSRNEQWPRSSESAASSLHEPLLDVAQLMNAPISMEANASSQFHPPVAISAPAPASPEKSNTDACSGHRVPDAKVRSSSSGSPSHHRKTLDTPASALNSPNSSASPAMSAWEADQVTSTTRAFVQQTASGLLQLDSIQSDAVRRSLRMRSERKALEIADHLDAEAEEVYQRRVQRRQSLSLMLTTFGRPPPTFEKADALLASVEGKHGKLRRVTVATAGSSLWQFCL